MGEGGGPLDVKVSRAGCVASGLGGQSGATVPGREGASSGSLARTGSDDRGGSDR